MFQDLRRGSHLSEKKLNYYSFKHKKPCNLGKLYLLPKIHRLYKVAGRPVISNCGTPTEHIENIIISS